MKLLKRVLSRLSGYAYPQEYLCLSETPFTDPLFAYWVVNDIIVSEITQDHVFIGYHPLLFAFASTKLPALSDHSIVILRFCPRALPVETLLNERDAIASLRLKRMGMQEIDGQITYCYQGIQGRHRFLPAFNQFMVQLHNWLYKHQTGNVYLDHGLYTQVQIAYALPRMISLITVGKENEYNLFPTDLNGQLNGGQYIISLRHEGKACEQVEATGRIVISTIEPSYCKEAYKLGKNHMQPLRTLEAFDFGNESSKLFGLPLPRPAISYRELELRDSFDCGIHRLLFFTIVNQEQNGSKSTNLSHIHNSYATWRCKHGMQGNYLLR